MVKSLIRVEHEVSKPNTQPKKETRYYISSFDFNELSAWEVVCSLGEGLLLPRPTTSATWGAPLLMQTQSSSATDHLPQEPASPSSYHAGHLNRKCLPLMQ